MNEKPDNNSKGINKTYRELAPYMGLGIQLALTVAVMVFLGIWLDKKLETSPYLTIAGSFIGVFAGLYNFIKTVLKSDK